MKKIKEFFKEMNPVPIMVTIVVVIIWSMILTSLLNDREEISVMPVQEVIVTKVLGTQPEKSAPAAVWESQADSTAIRGGRTDGAEEREEVIKEPEGTEEGKACSHSYMFESFYQEPTCSNGGLETQICSKCGERQTTPGTPTGKHEFITETEGDCVSEEIVICQSCNYREAGDKNKANHIDVEDGFCYGCGTKGDT